MFHVTIVSKLNKTQLKRVIHIIRSTLVRYEWARQYAPKMRIKFQKPNTVSDTDTLSLQIRYRLGSRNPSEAEQMALIDEITRELLIRKLDYTSDPDLAIHVVGQEENGLSYENWVHRKT